MRCCFLDYAGNEMIGVMCRLYREFNSVNVL